MNSIFSKYIPHVAHGLGRCLILVQTTGGILNLCLEVILITLFETIIRQEIKHLPYQGKTLGELKTCEKFYFSKLILVCLIVFFAFPTYSKDMNLFPNFLWMFQSFFGVWLIRESICYISKHET